MNVLERLYRSRFGKVMSIGAQFLARLHKPFMVYGWYDHSSSKFRKYTRISSTTAILNKADLSIGEYVWVWHYSILDATEGLSIEEGCQIGAWVGVFSHGSEISIRLLGKEYVNIPNKERMGYTRGSVKIGQYTFIGARSVILPGVTIGKGCIVGAGSVVSKDVGDYSIVVGAPSRVVGSTIDLDRKYFAMGDLTHTYYDLEALMRIRNGDNLHSP